MTGRLRPDSAARPTTTRSRAIVAGDRASDAAPSGTVRPRVRTARTAPERRPAARAASAADRAAPPCSLLLFLAGPIGYCVYTAFTDMHADRAPSPHVEFVGLANFRQAFARPRVPQRRLAAPLVFTAVRR